MNATMCGIPKHESQNLLSEFKKLQTVQQIIFSLNKENISQSTHLLINEFKVNYQYSLKLFISQMIYSSFVMRTNDFETFLRLIREIDKYCQNKIKVFDIFVRTLQGKHSHESYYLLEKIIRKKLVDSKVVKNLINSYFVHRIPKNNFNKIENDQFKRKLLQNLEELSKNDWELHKKYVKEGHNPNEIAKIIRNDEIEKLQEISSQINFDFNQKIKPSLYERCSFVNQIKVSLLDYAAFFSSIKCFKYLLMNGAKASNTGRYAVAGGNLEIIHLCEQNYSSFYGSYEVAIEFHRNDIFLYLYENKIIELNNLEELGKKCVLHHNYEILSFLQKEGMKINEDIINEAAKTGNIFLVKKFLKGNQLPKDILIYSSKSGNIELVKYILEQEGIDINTKNIYFLHLIFNLNILCFTIIFGIY